MRQILIFPGVFALKNHAAAWAVLICALTISVLSLPNLSFEEDVTKSFSSDSKYSLEYEKFVDELGFNPRDIIVFVESNSPFQIEDIHELRDLSLEFELADTVASVYSLDTVSFSPNHAIYSDEYLISEGMDIGQFRKRLSQLQKTEIWSPISSDLKSAIFVLSLEGSVNGIDLSHILEDLRSIVQKYGGEKLHYSFAGEPLVGPDLISALKHDLIFNCIAGFLISFILSAVIFNNNKLVLISALPTVFGSIAALSIFPILGFSISILSVVIPILVLVLTLANCVHLTMQFHDQSNVNNSADSILNTVTSVGPACALTAVTTSLAFIAISITDNGQLQEVGIIGALSILVGYVIAIMSFVLIAQHPGFQEQTDSNSVRFSIPPSLSSWILSRSRLIYLSCLVVFVFSAITIANLKPWFLLDQILPTNSEVRITNQKIVSKFGGFHKIWTEFDTSAEFDIRSEEGWDKLEMLTQTIREAAPDYPVISLSNLLGDEGNIHSPMSDESLEKLPKQLLNQLYSQDKKLTRVITVVPEAMQNETTLLLQDRLEKATIEAGATKNIGMPIVMRHESVAVIHQLMVGLVLAIVVSVMSAALYFRQPRLILVLVVPNTLPLMVSAAALNFLDNGHLVPTALLALTVAFGIAIDDSIHLVNRYAIEKTHGVSFEKSIKLAIEKTGRAMFITTIIICSGMFVTMLSSFETVSLFGELLIVTFITAIAADIFLLPNLLKIMETR